MPTIVNLGPIPDMLERRLRARFEVCPIAQAEAPEQIEVAVTTSMVGASAQQMAQLPRLQLILCNGAGLDRIDLAEAAARHIEVFNTADAVTTDTADYAVALLYAAKRRVTQADRFVRAGQWGKEAFTPTRRVSGSKVGIVGLGKIGTLVAQRMQGLGLEVGYHTPRPKPAAGLAYFDHIEQLAAWCDVLVLCCPATPATDRLVGSQVLQALGSAGTLINISRGSVVAEDDLIQALDQGVIAAAALDVFASEPALDSRLATLPNVILSPHAAAITVETRAEMAALLYQRAAAHFQAGLTG
ncbi:2-hydroxyacid dehydrogenase [Pseudomonas sp. NEEL19]|uniref:2-hydroxyacid dehydrogenase n=1 Tax=Pseudomonas sp. NEEL19 TaxID=2867409 RepID=UPI0023677296|nr:2-hydroxyacid dehydrogenase [Pseudomonas sp. NEEL19]WDM57238.1 2-hydroxyacid dehydrogenase [Pseudomonas sp. NEEL19]